MKKITLRNEHEDIRLILDFNRKIKDILDKENIVIDSNTVVEAVVSRQMVDINGSFNENNLENDEILLIKEHDVL